MERTFISITVENVLTILLILFLGLLGFAFISQYALPRLPSFGGGNSSASPAPDA